MPGVGASGKTLRFNSGFAYGEMIEWDDDLQCSIKSMPEQCVFLLVCCTQVVLDPCERTLRSALDFLDHLCLAVCAYAG